MCRCSFIRSDLELIRRDRLDGALDPWLKAVWSEIDQKYPLPEGVEVIPDDELYPFLKLGLPIDEYSAAKHTIP